MSTKHYIVGSISRSGKIVIKFFEDEYAASAYVSRVKNYSDAIRVAWGIIPTGVNAAVARKSMQKHLL